MSMARKAKTEPPPGCIPEAEQPYKVPDNWRWVKLTEGFAECKDNCREPINAKERGKRAGTIPYYGATGQVGWIDGYLTDEHLVLLGEDGAPFLDTFKNKAYIIDGKAWVNNHAHILKSYFGKTGNIFLAYYLNMFNYKGYVNGSTRLKLTQTNMSRIPVPLPPLPEQQRIVDRIENLFAKLDAARAAAQSVVDEYELRRNAILYRAFTGELTAGWREKNGISESTRKSASIASICHSMKYGTAKKSAPTGEVVVLRMGNLQHGEIVWSDLVYSDDVEDNKKYHLNPGDVLFNRTNSAEWVGKTSIYRGEHPAIYAGYLIRLDYDHDCVNGDYLNYMLNSPVAYDYCRSVKTDGVNQSNINARKIGAFTIPLPSMKEQEQICLRLKSLLNQKMMSKPELFTWVNSI